MKWVVVILLVSAVLYYSYPCEKRNPKDMTFNENVINSRVGVLESLREQNYWKARFQPFAEWLRFFKKLSRERPQEVKTIPISFVISESLGEEAVEDEGEQTEVKRVKQRKILKKVELPARKDSISYDEFLMYVSTYIQWAIFNYASCEVLLDESYFSEQDRKSLLTLFYEQKESGLTYLPKFIKDITGRDFTINRVSHKEMEALEDVKPLQFKGDAKKGTYLGLDFGRSDIKITLVKDGVVIKIKKLNWSPDTFSSFADPLSRIQELCDAVLTDAILEQTGIDIPDIKGVGVGTAGVVLFNRIIDSGIFSKLSEAEKRKASYTADSIRDYLYTEYALKVPVYIVNDGNIAAIKEMVDGRDEVEECAEKEEKGSTGVLILAGGSGLAAGCCRREGLLPFVFELGKVTLAMNRDVPIHLLYGIKAPALRYLSQNYPFEIARSLGLEIDDLEITVKENALRDQELLQSCHDYLVDEGVIEKENYHEFIVMKFSSCNLVAGTNICDHFITPES